MGVNGSELVIPFVGALQASVSVLLTILFGVLAAQFNLLSTGAAKEVSKTCVRMFLPALLIVKLGSELHQGTAIRYVPILVWALAYNLVSLAIGVFATRAFKLPSWATPALTFNNTTSLPLLLIQSLDATGILNSILKDGESTSAAINRAESYFLINAMVSNSLTFALGPKLLRLGDEDAPDQENKEEDEDSNRDSDSDSEQHAEQDEERGQAHREEDQGIIDEESSLLPQRWVRKANRLSDREYRRGHRQWERLPSWAQKSLDFAFQFANAPLIGAAIGAIIGLTPPLHRLFFSQFNDGGYLNAWLTSSIKNIGDLFASLQIIVVGVKLSQSLRRMKRGEENGEFSWQTFAFISFVRFFVWPLISIPLIYGLATKTGALDDDPMLWFAMMLMPTGPPAMILVALSDVTGSPDKEKMAIAKFLTASYAFTPMVCFAVVGIGSLKASEAAI